MLFIQFKRSLFQSTTVFFLLAIKTCSLTQNLSENNNGSHSYTTNSLSSTQSFQSKDNETYIYEKKGISNGRMRSFTHEEEEFQIMSREVNDSFKENYISEIGTQNVEENIKNDVTVVFTPTPIKLKTNSTYLHPLFHYQMKYDLIETNSTNSDINTKSNHTFIKANNSISIPRLEPSNHLNELKLANSKLIKIVKPRYRFRTDVSMHSNEKPMNTCKNNYTIITEKHIQSNCSNLENGFTKFSVEYKTQKLIQNTNESMKTDENEKNKTFESLNLKNEYLTTFSSLSQTQIPNNFENPESFSNSSESFCLSSMDCNIELNERCINRNKYSVCGCKEPFFREAISQKCQIKKLIRLIFRISSLNYSNHLNNSNSYEFIHMKHIIERSIWSVIINSSHLLTIVDNVKVLKFKPFLVIVDFYVKISNPTNSFHEKYLEYHFWYKLMSVIKGINVTTHKPIDKFNILDLQAIEIDNNINYCSIKELNYCSANAICIESDDSESKFECKCNNGLTDFSPNVNFSGEICAVKCDSQLCAFGGFCQIKDETHLHCICTNWSFGTRCQYSINIILSFVALFLLLLILFAFCLASIYCGHRIRLEFIGLRTIIESNNANVENSLRKA